MRFNGRLWRLLALFFGFTMIVAACGDDSGDDDSASSDTTEASSDTTAPDGGTADGVLKVGTILPETGDLAFLGPPEFAG
ncbi:MAG: amino acid ABC transporter substrate-binding protein, partial [Acidimicrobiales bacterium]